jgi:hypothetical protein
VEVLGKDLMPGGLQTYTKKLRAAIIIVMTLVNVRFFISILIYVNNK